MLAIAVRWHCVPGRQIDQPIILGQEVSKLLRHDEARRIADMHGFRLLPQLAAELPTFSTMQ